MHAAFCQFYCALIILFCVVGLTIETGGVLLGQEMQKDKLKDDTVLIPFIVKSSWLKFGVFDGRILAQDIRRTHSRSLTLYHDSQEAEEHLVVRALPGKYRIKYALQTPQELLQLEYDIAGVLFVRREIAGVNVQLRQSTTGPIRIQVEKGDSISEYVSNRLWLGLMLMPESERKYAVELMDRLCPGTHVSLLYNEALSALKRLSFSPLQLEASQIRALVALLDDESFAVRQQADRQLRSIGRPLLGVLENVDYSGLSVEQRTRLRLIVEKYKVVERDSVASIIASMRWNPQLWQVFAADKHDGVLAINSKRRLQQLIGEGRDPEVIEALNAGKPVLLKLR